MAQESEEGFVILLSISHAVLQASIVIASHSTDFLSNGVTYLACPFEVSLPGDDPEANSAVELIVDNVSPVIAAGVRAIQPGSIPPTVAMSVVTIATPDVVEVGPFHLVIAAVSINRLHVSASLTYEPILDQLYPSGTMNPLDFPGMF